MQDQNRFNVDAPTASIPLSLIPTAAAEGKITYAQVRFEDNSVDMWERLSDQLPAFWKQVKGLKEEKSKIDFKAIQEKYRVHTFNIQKEEEEKRRLAKIEAEKVTKERYTEQTAIRLTEIKNQEASELVRKRTREAAKRDNEIKSAHTSRGLGFQNAGRRLQASYILGELSIDDYQRNTQSLRNAMHKAARNKEAYGGDVNAAETAYTSFYDNYVALRKEYERIMKIEDEKEKAEQRALYLNQLKNVSKAGGFTYPVQTHTNIPYIDTAGGL